MVMVGNGDHGQPSAQASMHQRSGVEGLSGRLLVGCGVYVQIALPPHHGASPSERDHWAEGRYRVVRTKKTDRQGRAEPRSLEPRWCRITPPDWGRVTFAGPRKSVPRPGPLGHPTGLPGEPDPNAS